MRITGKNTSNFVDIGSHNLTPPPKRLQAGFIVYQEQSSRETTVRLSHPHIASESLRDGITVSHSTSADFSRIFGSSLFIFTVRLIGQVSGSSGSYCSR